MLYHVNDIGRVYSLFKGVASGVNLGLKIAFTGVAKMLLQPSSMLLRGLAQ